MFVTNHNVEIDACILLQAVIIVKDYNEAYSSLM